MTAADHSTKAPVTVAPSITRIPPDRLRSTLPAPRAVKIEISPRCNYRCNYRCGFCALREADLRKDVRGTLCEACIAYN